MKLQLARFSFILITTPIACLPLRSFGQPQPRSDGPEDRVTTRIGTNRVTITVTGGERIISANGWPDHKPGEFPRPGNPNSISPQNYNFHLPAHPEVAAQPTP